MPCVYYYSSPEGTPRNQPRVKRRESANVAQPWVGKEYADKNPEGGGPKHM